MSRNENPHIVNNGGELRCENNVNLAEAGKISDSSYLYETANGILYLPYSIPEIEVQSQYDSGLHVSEYIEKCAPGGLTFWDVGRAPQLESHSLGGTANSPLKTSISNNATVQKSSKAASMQMPCSSRQGHHVQMPTMQNGASEELTHGDARRAPQLESRRSEKTANSPLKTLNRDNATVQKSKSSSSRMSCSSHQQNHVQMHTVHAPQRVSNHISSKSFAYERPSRCVPEKFSQNRAELRNGTTTVREIRERGNIRAIQGSSRVKSPKGRHLSRWEKYWNSKNKKRHRSEPPSSRKTSSNVPRDRRHKTYHGKGFPNKFHAPDNRHQGRRERLGTGIITTEERTADAGDTVLGEECSVRDEFRSESVSLKKCHLSRKDKHQRAIRRKRHHLEPSITREVPLDLLEDITRQSNHASDKTKPDKFHVPYIVPKDPRQRCNYRSTNRSPFLKIIKWYKEDSCKPNHVYRHSRTRRDHDRSHKLDNCDMHSKNNRNSSLEDHSKLPSCHESHSLSSDSKSSLTDGVLDSTESVTSPVVLSVIRPKGNEDLMLLLQLLTKSGKDIFKTSIGDGTSLLIEIENLSFNGINVAELNPDLLPSCKDPEIDVRIRNLEVLENSPELSPPLALPGPRNFQLTNQLHLSSCARASNCPDVSQIRVRLSRILLHFPEISCKSSSDHIASSSFHGTPTLNTCSKTFETFTQVPDSSDCLHPAEPPTVNFSRVFADGVVIPGIPVSPSPGVSLDYKVTSIEYEGSTDISSKTSHTDVSHNAFKLFSNSILSRPPSPPPELAVPSLDSSPYFSENNSKGTEKCNSSFPVVPWTSLQGPNTTNKVSNGSDEYPCTQSTTEVHLSETKKAGEVARYGESSTESQIFLKRRNICSPSAIQKASNGSEVIQPQTCFSSEHPRIGKADFIKITEPVRKTISDKTRVVSDTFSELKGPEPKTRGSQHYIAKEKLSLNNKPKLPIVEGSSVQPTSAPTFESNKTLQFNSTSHASIEIAVTSSMNQNHVDSKTNKIPSRSKRNTCSQNDFGIRSSFHSISERPPAEVTEEQSANPHNVNGPKQNKLNTCTSRNSSYNHTPSVQGTASPVMEHTAKGNLGKPAIKGTTAVVMEHLLDSNLEKPSVQKPTTAGMKHVVENNLEKPSIQRPKSHAARHAMENKYDHLKKVDSGNAKKLHDTRAVPFTKLKNCFKSSSVVKSNNERDLTQPPSKKHKKDLKNVLDSGGRCANSANNSKVVEQCVKRVADEIQEPSAKKTKLDLNTALASNKAVSLNNARKSDETLEKICEYMKNSGIASKHKFKEKGSKEVSQSKVMVHNLNVCKDSKDNANNLAAKKENSHSALPAGVASSRSLMPVSSDKRNPELTSYDVTNNTNEITNKSEKTDFLAPRKRATLRMRHPFLTKNGRKISKRFLLPVKKSDLIENQETTNCNTDISRRLANLSIRYRLRSFDKYLERIGLKDLDPDQTAELVTGCAHSKTEKPKPKTKNVPETAQYFSNAGCAKKVSERMRTAKEAESSLKSSTTGISLSREKSKVPKKQRRSEVPKHKTEKAKVAEVSLKSIKADISRGRPKVPQKQRCNEIVKSRYSEAKVAGSSLKSTPVDISRKSSRTTQKQLCSDILKNRGSGVEVAESSLKSTKANFPLGNPKPPQKQLRSEILKDRGSEVKISKSSLKSTAANISLEKLKAPQKQPCNDALGNRGSKSDDFPSDSTTPAGNYIQTLVGTSVNKKGCYIPEKAKTKFMIYLSPKHITVNDKSSSVPKKCVKGTNVKGASKGCLKHVKERSAFNRKSLSRKASKFSCKLKNRGPSKGNSSYGSGGNLKRKRTCNTLQNGIKMKYRRIWNEWLNYDKSIVKPSRCTPVKHSNYANSRSAETKSSSVRATCNNNADCVDESSEPVAKPKRLGHASSRTEKIDFARSETSSEDNSLLISSNASDVSDVLIQDVANSKTCHSNKSSKCKTKEVKKAAMRKDAEFKNIKSHQRQMHKTCKYRKETCDCNDKHPNTCSNAMQDTNSNTSQENTDKSCFPTKLSDDEFINHSTVYCKKSRELISKPLHFVTEGTVPQKLRPKSCSGPEKKLDPPEVVDNSSTECPQQIYRILRSRTIAIMPQGNRRRLRKPAKIPKQDAKNEFLGNFKERLPGKDISGSSVSDTLLQCTYMSRNGTHHNIDNTLCTDDPGAKCLETQPVLASNALEGHYLHSVKRSEATHSAASNDCINNDILQVKETISRELQEKVDLNPRVIVERLQSAAALDFEENWFKNRRSKVRNRTKSVSSIIETPQNLNTLQNSQMIDCYSSNATPVLENNKPADNIHNQALYSFPETESVRCDLSESNTDDDYRLDNGVTGIGCNQRILSLNNCKTPNVSHGESEILPVLDCNKRFGDSADSDICKTVNSNVSTRTAVEKIPFDSIKVVRRKQTENDKTERTCSGSSTEIIPTLEFYGNMFVATTTSDRVGEDDVCERNKNETIAESRRRVKENAGALRKIVESIHAIECDRTVVVNDAENGKALKTSSVASAVCDKIMNSEAIVQIKATETFPVTRSLKTLESDAVEGTVKNPEIEGIVSVENDIRNGHSAKSTRSERKNIVESDETLKNRADGDNERTRHVPSLDYVENVLSSVLETNGRIENAVISGKTLESSGAKVKVDAVNDIDIVVNSAGTECIGNNERVENIKTESNENVESLPAIECSNRVSGEVCEKEKFVESETNNKAVGNTQGVKRKCHVKTVDDDIAPGSAKQKCYIVDGASNVRKSVENILDEKVLRHKFIEKDVTGKNSTVSKGAVKSILVVERNGPASIPSAKGTNVEKASTVINKPVENYSIIKCSKSAQSAPKHDKIELGKTLTCSKLVTNNLKAYKFAKGVAFSSGSKIIPVKVSKVNCGSTGRTVTGIAKMFKISPDCTITLVGDSDRNYQTAMKSICAENKAVLRIPVIERSKITKVAEAKHRASKNVTDSRTVGNLLVPRFNHNVVCCDKGGDTTSNDIDVEILPNPPVTKCSRNVEGTAVGSDRCTESDPHAKTTVDGLTDGRSTINDLDKTRLEFDKLVMSSSVETGDSADTSSKHTARSSVIQCAKTVPGNAADMDEVWSSGVVKNKANDSGVRIAEKSIAVAGQVIKCHVIVGGVDVENDGMKDVSGKTVGNLPLMCDKTLLTSSPMAETSSKVVEHGAILTGSDTVDIGKSTDASCCETAEVCKERAGYEWDGGSIPEIVNIELKSNDRDLRDEHLITLENSTFVDGVVNDADEREMVKDTDVENILNTVVSNIITKESADNLSQIEIAVSSLSVEKEETVENALPVSNSSVGERNVCFEIGVDVRNHKTVKSSFKKDVATDFRNVSSLVGNKSDETFTSSVTHELTENSRTCYDSSNHDAENYQLRKESLKERSRNGENAPADEKRYPLLLPDCSSCEDNFPNNTDVGSDVDIFSSSIQEIRAKSHRRQGRLINISNCLPKYRKAMRQTSLPTFSEVSCEPAVVGSEQQTSILPVEANRTIRTGKDSTDITHHNSDQGHTSHLQDVSDKTVGAAGSGKETSINRPRDGKTAVDAKNSEQVFSNLSDCFTFAKPTSNRVNHLEQLSCRLPVDDNRNAYPGKRPVHIRECAYTPASIAHHRPNESVRNTFMDNPGNIPCNAGLQKQSPLNISNCSTNRTHPSEQLSCRLPIGIKDNRNSCPSRRPARANTTHCRSNESARILFVDNPQNILCNAGPQKQNPLNLSYYSTLDKSTSNKAGHSEQLSCRLPMENESNRNYFPVQSPAYTSVTQHASHRSLLTGNPEKTVRNREPRRKSRGNVCEYFQRYRATFEMTNPSEQLPYRLPAADKHDRNSCSGVTPAHTNYRHSNAHVQNLLDNPEKIPFCADPQKRSPLNLSNHSTLDETTSSRPNQSEISCRLPMQNKDNPDSFLTKRPDHMSTTHHGNLFMGNQEETFRNRDPFRKNHGNACEYFTHNRVTDEATNKTKTYRLPVEDKDNRNPSCSIIPAHTTHLHSNANVQNFLMVNPENISCNADRQKLSPLNLSNYFTLNKTAKRTNNSEQLSCRLPLEYKDNRNFCSSESSARTSITQYRSNGKVRNFADNHKKTPCNANPGKQSSLNISNFARNETTTKNSEQLPCRLPVEGRGSRNPCKNPAHSPHRLSNKNHQSYSMSGDVHNQEESPVKECDNVTGCRTVFPDSFSPSYGVLPNPLDVRSFFEGYRINGKGDYNSEHGRVSDLCASSNTLPEPSTDCHPVSGADRDKDGMDATETPVVKSINEFGKDESIDSDCEILAEHPNCDIRTEKKNMLGAETEDESKGVDSDCTVLSGDENIDCEGRVSRSKKKNRLGGTNVDEGVENILSGDKSVDSDRNDIPIEKRNMLGSETVDEEVKNESVDQDSDCKILSEDEATECVSNAIRTEKENTLGVGTVDEGVKNECTDGDSDCKILSEDETTECVSNAIRTEKKNMLGTETVNEGMENKYTDRYSYCKILSEDEAVNCDKNDIGSERENMLQAKTVGECVRSKVIDSNCMTVSDGEKNSLDKDIERENKLEAISDDESSKNNCKDTVEDELSITPVSSGLKSSDLPEGMKTEYKSSSEEKLSTVTIKHDDSKSETPESQIEKQQEEFLELYGIILDAPDIKKFLFFKDNFEPEVVLVPDDDPVGKPTTIVSDVVESKSDLLTDEKCPDVFSDSCKTNRNVSLKNCEIRLQDCCTKSKKAIVSEDDLKKDSNETGSSDATKCQSLNDKLPSETIDFFSHSISDVIQANARSNRLLLSQCSPVETSTKTPSQLCPASQINSQSGSNISGSVKENAKTSQECATNSRQVREDLREVPPSTDKTGTVDPDRIPLARIKTEPLLDGYDHPADVDNDNKDLIRKLIKMEKDDSYPTSPPVAFLEDGDVRIKSEVHYEGFSDEKPPGITIEGNRKIVINCKRIEDFAELSLNPPPGVSVRISYQFPGVTIPERELVKSEEPEDDL